MCVCVCVCVCVLRVCAGVFRVAAVGGKQSDLLHDIRTEHSLQLVMVNTSGRASTDSITHQPSRIKLYSHGNILIEVIYLHILYDLIDVK